MHLNADEAHFRLSAVVEATVMENELHVLHEFLNALILVILQLCPYR